MGIINKFKGYLFPRVSKEAETYVDMEAVKNIYYVCLAVAILESISLIIFMIFKKQMDEESYISVRSVAFCVAACVVGHSIARVMLDRNSFSHLFVMVFEIVYYVSLSAWGIMISYRHYVAGEQMLTFFTVELIMVCFVLLKPLISVVLMSFSYIALYIGTYMYDKSVRVHPINYLMLMLVSIVGMIVRYHLQLRTSKKTVLLMENNRSLEQLNRLDGLTGLNNRRALDDDVDGFIGKQVSIFMIDINYFKEINDNYGHMIGDDILRETGQRLKRLYPGSEYYRYGGDEFLVVNDSSNSELYEEDTYTFMWPDRNRNIEVFISIGNSTGSPSVREEFFELLSDADTKLYETKTWTHSPENGGHERRRDIVNSES